MHNPIEYCKVCSHKSFDIKTGIVCGITKQKPTFTDNCPDYKPLKELVQKEEKKMQSKNDARKGESKAKIALGLLLFICFVNTIANIFVNTSNLRIPSIISFIIIVGLTTAILKGYYKAKNWLTFILIIRIIFIFITLAGMPFFIGSIVIYTISIALITFYGYIVYLLNGDKQFQAFLETNAL